MRIAYLCADRGVPLGGTKGASIHVWSVVKALFRRNHQLHLLVSRAERKSLGFPIPVTEIGFDRTLKELRQAIDGKDRNSILSREVHNLLLNTRAVEALDALHRQWPVDGIYERYSLWSWAGMRFARQHQIPWVLEVNAPLITEQHTYRELKLTRVAQGMEKLLLKEADSVVVPSAELRAYIDKRIGRRRRVVVLPNGADLDLFEAPPALPSPAARRLRNRFVLAFVGSLKPWHGVEHLLNGFEKLIDSVPEAHLLVIGDGPLRQTVETAARRWGRRRASVTGAVPHEQIPSWLAHADIGLAPYPHLPDFYFSPLKVVEYLAAGLPVVASAIGQIVKLVEHERTGFLVPPGDEDALVKAILRLYEDQRLRVRMARRARRRARERHDWARVAEQVEGIFLESRPAARLQPSAAAPAKRAVS